MVPKEERVHGTSGSENTLHSSELALTDFIYLVRSIERSSIDLGFQKEGKKQKSHSENIC